MPLSQVRLSDEDSAIMKQAAAKEGNNLADQIAISAVRDAKAVLGIKKPAKKAAKRR